MAKADKQAEYDEICSLTNPTVKKALLKSFADDCDAAAVHLQAAALPRQKYQVKAEVKKASQQALAQARSSVGAKRSNIEITDKEWEAIQAGAISENKLTQILNNTNTDTIRQRATPRASTALSTAKQNRIAALSASGYSTSEIAEALGVSSSTVSKYLNGKE